MLKILIADDHELFLDGLRLVLSDLDSEITVDTASNHHELQQKADGKTAYDLILTDFYADVDVIWSATMRSCWRAI